MKCPQCHQEGFAGERTLLSITTRGKQKIRVQWFCRTCAEPWFAEKSLPTIETKEKCPFCEKRTEVYLFINQLHGNIATPASDSEVEFHYRCRLCKSQWVEDR